MTVLAHDFGSRARARAGFGPALAVSTVLHGGALVATLVIAGVNRPPPLDLDPMPVELVTLGKPRYPKLLPRKVKPRPAGPEGPGPAPKAASPEPPSGKPEAPRSEGAVALETDEAKKPKAPETKTPKRERKGKPENKPKRLSAGARALLEGGGRDVDSVLERFEEPEGSPEGFVDGTTTDPSAAANAYEARVKSILKARYELPAHLQARRQWLEATVVLWIGPNGDILRYEFEKPHANAQFMAALERLLKTVSLPAPPPATARRYREQGLAIRFRP